MKYKTFTPSEKIPKNTILPVQTHSTNIQEIITGEEDLKNTDGLWSQNPEFILGVKTADCAPIIFIGEKKFGILHAGWRGLVNGIIENMFEVFSDETPKIWIGPLYPIFEIQKDECYEKIKKKFGEKFFSEKNSKTYFYFLSSIFSIVSNAEFHGESTFNNTHFASWRRDKTEERNITIVGKMK